MSMLRKNPLSPVMAMATGIKKQTVATQIPIKQVSELERRAAAIGLSKSKYFALMIEDWLASGRKLTLTEK